LQTDLLREGVHVLDNLPIAIFIAGSPYLVPPNYFAQASLQNGDLDCSSQSNRNAFVV